MGYSAGALVDAVAAPAAVVDAGGMVLACNTAWAASPDAPATPPAIDAGVTCVHPAAGADHMVRVAPVETDGGERHRLVTIEPAQPPRCESCGAPVGDTESIAQAKSEFLALLGHELRTPVSAVVGSVDVLRALPLAQDVRELVDGVHRSTGLLKAMIDDLLDLARLQTGHLDLDERPLSLRALLDEVIEPLQQQVRRKGLLLLAGVAPDLPGAIVADAGRLRQVLTNVVGNGVKFTERGEVVVTATRDGDGGLLITVSDTGPGLAEADRERVFAPFVQRDSSSARRHEGAGLGLTLASRLVERMGGSINVDSEVGRGSEFHLRLPLVPAGGAGPDVPRKAARVALAAPSPRSALVLRWMLTATGADVVPTTLTDVARHPPDVDAVVWCDDSHTAEAAQRAETVIAALPPTTRAIMITTTDPRRGVVRGPALITSPLTVPRLAAVVHRERTGVRGAPVAVPRLPGGRVLLAEDNDVNRTVLSRMIALLGVECEAVADGAAAVDAVLAGPGYAVVLMDMQMPGVDGLEATRRIRAAGVEVPILALTATALRGDRERCLASGMNGYLSKPITLSGLGDALAEYLKPEPEPELEPALASLAPAPPGPAGTGDAAVDLSKLRDLEEQLADPPLVVRTVATYLDQLANRREALSDAVHRHDRDAVRAAAHTLKSSSALLGATSLAAACARVELAADVDDEDLARLVGEVDSGAVAAAAELAEYVAAGQRGR
jgi:CheY-like chemotaxis protein/HPt (histidine-containing phosphotransfer) domain-containing protein